ncbi:hypothetical protein D3C80_1979570 [compost metagenome]
MCILIGILGGITLIRSLNDLSCLQLLLIPKPPQITVLLTNPIFKLIQLIFTGFLLLYNVFLQRLQRA